MRSLRVSFFSSDFDMFSPGQSGSEAARTAIYAPRTTLTADPGFGSATGTSAASIDRLVGRPACLLTGSFDGCLAYPLRLGARFAFGADVFQLLVGQMLDADKGIMRGADPNEFVELDLDGGA